MILKSKFAMFTLKDSKPGEPLLLHDEPIYTDDKIIHTYDLNRMYDPKIVCMVQKSLLSSRS